MRGVFMAERGDKDKPDFALGYSVLDLPDGGMVLGHVDAEDVVLARSGEHLFAVGAHCTHYHGPLADGMVVGDTVRCPWHHACFSLRDGEALRSPSLSPLPCWTVSRHGDRITLGDKIERAPLTASYPFKAKV